MPQYCTGSSWSLAYPDVEGTVTRAGLIFFIEHFTESFCYYLSIVYSFLLMLLLVLYMLCRSGEEITPLYPSKTPLFPTEDYSLLIIYFIYLPCVLPISPSANFVITATSNALGRFVPLQKNAQGSFATLDQFNSTSSAMWHPHSHTFCIFSHF